MKNSYFSVNLKILIFLAADAFSFYVAFTTTSLLSNFITLPPPPPSIKLVFLLFVALWCLLENTFNKNKSVQLRVFSFKDTVVNLCTLLLLHILLLYACLKFTNQYRLEEAYFGCIYAISLLLVSANRFFLFCLFKLYKKLNPSQNKFIIIGAGPTVTPFYQYIVQNTHLYGKEFVGFFDNNPIESPYSSQIIGPITEVKEYCLREGINEIYYALPLRLTDLLEEISQFADDHYIYFRIVPDMNALMKKETYLHYYDEIPVLTIRKEPLEIRVNRIAKRTFDILFSSLVILLIFPWLFPIIILAIKLNSAGPVFFRQNRAGIKKRPFLCYKFRTMYVNTIPHVQATKHDPRVTEVGRFLRKTSLDELPQFFNVLLGDMSVVGPRPYIFYQVEQYSKIIDTYKIRHFVPPGITGYAQVNGYRGEVQRIELMEKRVKYDILYVENWSLLLDFKIVLLTVLNIFKGEKNAY